MTENKEIKEPLLIDVSEKKLKVLLVGYLRSSSSNTNSEFTQEIYNDLLTLCVSYYEKPLYMAVFNCKELKVTLLDTGTDDTVIRSNNLVNLNRNDEEPNVGCIEEIGICQVKDINVGKLCAKIKLSNERKYNAIFKIGGDDWRNQNNNCRLILYTQDIDSNSQFESHYYNLPKVPFKSCYNNPVYSDKYGLISIVGGQKKNQSYFGEIGFLNLNEKNKWNFEKLPQELRFSYHAPPDYCLVNNSLFIINGSTETGDENYISQTSIFNFETKKHKILQDNPVPYKKGALVYNKNTNKIWIASGNSSCREIFYYDLHKNEYCNSFLKTPKKSYYRPIIYLNEQGT
eukprot:15281_1